MSFSPSSPHRLLPFDASLPKSPVEISPDVPDKENLDPERAVDEDSVDAVCEDISKGLKILICDDDDDDDDEIELEKYNLRATAPVPRRLEDLRAAMASPALAGGLSVEAPASPGVTVTPFRPRDPVVSAKSRAAPKRLEAATVAAEGDAAARTPFRADGYLLRGSHVDFKMLTPSLSNRDVVCDGEFQLLLEHRTLQRELATMTEEKEDLMVRLKETDARVDLLRNQVSNMQRQHEAEMKSVKKTFEGHLAAKTGVINTLQTVIEQQDQKIKSLESATCSSPADELSKLVDDLHALRSERRSLHSDKIHLVNDLQMHKSENEQLKMRLHEMSNLISPTTPQTPENKRQILKETQRQARELRLHERQYKQQIFDLNVKLKNTKKTLDSTTAAKIKNESLVRVAQEAAKKLEAEKERLQNKALATEVELATKNKIIAETRQAHKNEFSVRLDENLKIGKELREATASRERLAADLQRLREEFSKTRAELSTSNRELTSLKSKAKEAEMSCHQRDADSKRLETLRGDKQNLEAELNALSSKCSLLESELKSTWSLYAAVSKDFEESRVKTMDLEVKNGELEAELVSSRKLCEESLQNTEQVVSAAVAKTRLDFQEENVRLKTLTGNLASGLRSCHEELKKMRKEHEDFRHEFHQLPAWYSKVFKHYGGQIDASISSVSDHNAELTRRYVKEMSLRKKYHNELVRLKGNIRVMARVRPALVDDLHVLTFDDHDDGVIYVHNRGRSTAFGLDKVFIPSTTQEEMFEEVKPLVVSSIDGFNVCIFAYGHTGSGKTYTMEGPENDPGINQRALSLLFEKTSEQTTGDWDYEITLAQLEIYNENVYDLLSSPPCVKLDSTTPGLPSDSTRAAVASLEDVRRLLATGRRNRATASTNSNERSSRSHALTNVRIKGRNRLSGAETVGRLNLVDLAGSENVARAGAEGVRLEESKFINSSLSALGNVINALRCKRPHIPYRNSKLTRILETSLCGDSKSLLVIQVAPEARHVTGTKHSLDFGQRAKTVELNAQASSNRRPGNNTPKSNR